MARLSSNGDIIIPKSDHSTFHFLLLNAQCYLVGKKESNLIDTASSDLVSELLGYLNKNRRKIDGKLE